jgi:ferritin-like metal-binding protein YciE
VKLIVKKLRTLNELYENQLQMLLSAEEQISRLLLDMQEWAGDDELRSTFQSQQQETELQVPRIRTLVSANATETKPVRCKVVAALAAETEDMVADAADHTVRDVVLRTYP